MPAKRKTASKSKKMTKSRQKSNGMIESYFAQRDEFYNKHPNSRVLLGVLIVVFAMAIGVLYYNQTQVFIGLTLDSYGIRYPIVDPVSAQK